MSLTEREKEIALECAKKMLGFKPSHGTLLVGMMSDFISRLREEQEAVAWEITQRYPKKEIMLSRASPNSVSEEDKAEYMLSFIPLFTTPPAAPMSNEELLDRYQSLQEDFVNINKSCSELVEALNYLRKYLIGELGYEIDEVLANHAKRMKGEE